MVVVVTVSIINDNVIGHVTLSANFSEKSTSSACYHQHNHHVIKFLENGKSGDVERLGQRRFCRVPLGQALSCTILSCYSISLLLFSSLSISSKNLNNN